MLMRELKNAIRVFFSFFAVRCSYLDVLAGKLWSEPSAAKECQGSVAQKIKTRSV